MIRDFFAREPAVRKELARIDGLPRVWNEKILPDGASREFLERRGLPYLLKPARIGEIRDRVRELLQGQKDGRKLLLEEG